MGISTEMSKSDDESFSTEWTQTQLLDYWMIACQEVETLLKKLFEGQAVHEGPGKDSDYTLIGI